MEAKDLRIGNLVCYRDKEWTPLFVSNLGNTFETVTIDDILYGSDDITEYNPIPLTEEWILNFGFNVSEGLFGESYTLNNISIWTATKGNLCFCWDRFMKEIKYVHQLQNLYFTLTGEDLTLQN